MNTRISGAIGLAFVIAGTFGLGGCLMEPVDGEAAEDESLLDDASLADNANDNEVGDEDVASAEQAVYSGFTAFTSEEYLQPVQSEARSVS